MGLYFSSRRAWRITHCILIVTSGWQLRIIMIAKWNELFGLWPIFPCRSPRSLKLFNLIAVFALQIHVIGLLLLFAAAARSFHPTVGLFSPYLAEIGTSVQEINRPWLIPNDDIPLQLALASLVSVLPCLSCNESNVAFVSTHQNQWPPFS